MILVTGATGFLGKRVCHLLDREAEEYCPTSLSLGVDLRDWRQTKSLFDEVRPTHIVNCAAYVGGIQFGYKHPVELFHNNSLMTINMLKAANEYSVERIVNPISNCSYPARATLFRENEFWDGPLHESVLVYGFVRKMSWVGAWAYHRQYGLDILNLILSNMYGPEDHFEAERSHALGALVMKICLAKIRNDREVVVWGSGEPVREWLHVDDGAEAMVRALDAKATEDPVNIGVGRGISIKQLVDKIVEYIGYTGTIRFDRSRPDGAPYKTVDGTRGEKLLGWCPGIDLDQGIRETITWFMKHRAVELNLL